MPDAQLKTDGHATAAAKLQEALHRALDALEPELRSVFLLRDMEKLSGDDAARRLQLSPSTVKARLQRARKEICRLLWQQFDQGQADLQHDVSWKALPYEAERSSKPRRAPRRAA